MRRSPDGRWVVFHMSSALGKVEVHGSSREGAIRKMRDELQYRAELCPCSGVSGDTVEVEITSENTNFRFGPE
jgi:hypothetical protein